MYKLCISLTIFITFCITVWSALWLYTKFYVPTTCTQTHIHTHAHIHMHTHTLRFQHTHIQMHMQSKVSSCCQDDHTDSDIGIPAWVLIRCYESVLANPLGGELVYCWWGCTMPRVMVWAPKVPQGSRPLVDMDSSLTFTSPVITRYPLMLQLGGLFPQLAPGPHLMASVLLK